jgi:hypothetical protein
VSTLNDFGCTGCSFTCGRGGELFRLDVAEELFDLRQRGLGVDIAGDHQNGIVRGVPGVVKALQHLRRGLLERRPRSQRIVHVRRPRKHCRADLRIQDVRRLGEILRYLLFDGAALVIPFLFRIQHPTHACGLDMQGDIEILSRHGVEVLREAFPRIGVEVTAYHAADVGQLIGGQARTAPEHHVFLGVRRARETDRALIGADEIVDRSRDHRCQGVAHDDDTQAIRQRRAERSGRLVTGRRGRLGRTGLGQQELNRPRASQDRAGLP